MPGSPSMGQCVPNRRVGHVQPSGTIPRERYELSYANSAVLAGRPTKPAPTNFGGEAPGFTAGVMQVNALVPESVTPGNAVPVTITIGGVTSQAGVTLAVK